MNAEEQIDILRKAGFFQDGEDAYSLIAAFAAMQSEIEYLTEELAAKKIDSIPTKEGAD
jgi:hypothetical protein